MNNLQDLITELTSGDDERAEAAIPDIAARGGEALSLLRELLQAPEEDTRWWAARALAEIPDPHAPLWLVGLLRDIDAGVRQCALLGLRVWFYHHGVLHRPGVLNRHRLVSRATPALIAALDDPEPMCASLAADVLATIGEPAVPALLEMMQQGSAPARLEAGRAFVTIRDQHPTLTFPNPDPPYSHNQNADSKPCQE